MKTTRIARRIIAAGPIASFDLPPELLTCVVRCVAEKDHKFIHMAGTSKQWREQVRVVQSEQDASSPGVAILGHLVLSVGRLSAYGPSTGATTESKRLVSEPPIG